MGDHNEPHDSSSSDESDIVAYSGHTDREKTDSSPAPGSENGGVDAPRPQRTLLRPQFTHPNEQLASPENIRAQSVKALALPNDVSEEPPPLEGARTPQVDEATSDIPWWERSPRKTRGAQADGDTIAYFAALGVCLDVPVDGRSSSELGELLGLEFRTTRTSPVYDEDPEIGPLIEEAGENREANTKGAQLQDYQGGQSRVPLDERRQDINRCKKCLNEEKAVIMLPCGHCLYCKKCFHHYYVEGGRPVRCPECKEVLKSHDFL